MTAPQNRRTAVASLRSSVPLALVVVAIALLGRKPWVAVVAGPLAVVARLSGDMLRARTGKGNWRTWPAAAIPGIIVFIVIVASR